MNFSSLFTARKSTRGSLSTSMRSVISPIAWLCLSWITWHYQPGESLEPIGFLLRYNGVSLYLIPSSIAGHVQTKPRYFSLN